MLFSSRHSFFQASVLFFSKGNSDFSKGYSENINSYSHIFVMTFTDLGVSRGAVVIGLVSLGMFFIWSLVMGLIWCNLLSNEPLPLFHLASARAWMEPVQNVGRPKSHQNRGNWGSFHRENTSWDRGSTASIMDFLSYETIKGFFFQLWHDTMKSFQKWLFSYYWVEFCWAFQH